MPILARVPVSNKSFFRSSTNKKKNEECPVCDWDAKKWIDHYLEAEEKIAKAKRAGRRAPRNTRKSLRCLAKKGEKLWCNTDKEVKDKKESNSPNAWRKYRKTEVNK